MANISSWWKEMPLLLNWPKDAPKPKNGHLMLQCTYSHDTYMSIYYVDVNSSSSQATKYQFLKLRNICLISSAIPTPWRGVLPPAWRPGGAFIGRPNIILSTSLFSFRNFFLSLLEVPLGTEEENLNFYKSIFRSKRRPRWRGAFDHVFSLPTLEPDGNLCSRSSTLGSFNRLKKTERGEGGGPAAGPLVILTPPPSSTSAPTPPAPGDSGSPSELGHRMESQPLSNVQPSPSSLNAPSGKYLSIF